MTHASIPKEEREKAGVVDNLLRLTYPHELITLGFITPKNKDGNANIEF